MTDAAPRAVPHRLTQVDGTCLTGICSECGPVRVYRRTAGGFQCAPAQLARMAKRRESREYRRREDITKRPYLEHRLGACERCGHIPLAEAALSVHHLDLDHKNNDPSNLRTLCLNCHAEVHALHRAQEEALADHATPAAVAA